MQLACHPVGDEVGRRIGLVGIAVMEFTAGVLAQPFLQRDFQRVPDVDAPVGRGVNDTVPEAGKTLDTRPDRQLDAQMRRVGVVDVQAR